MHDTTRTSEQQAEAASLATPGKVTVRTPAFDPDAARSRAGARHEAALAEKDAAGAALLTAQRAMVEDPGPETEQRCRVTRANLDAAEAHVREASAALAAFDQRRAQGQARDAWAERQRIEDEDRRARIHAAHEHTRQRSEERFYERFTK
jgi:hypothetical protein